LTTRQNTRRSQIKQETELAPSIHAVLVSDHNDLLQLDTTSFP